MIVIDINADVGEGTIDVKIGNDEILIPLVSSVNIACTYHGGDKEIMLRAIDLALSSQCRIGAHPSYKDRAGFGRYDIAVTDEALSDHIIDQLSILDLACKAQGAFISYVKPHGALYNRMAVDLQRAEVVIKAIKTFDDRLSLMGMAGSPLENYCEGRIPFIAEAFLDRTYETDKTLRARSLEGAVIDTIAAFESQFKLMVLDRHVLSYDGISMPIHADTYCLHGDQTMSVTFAQQVQQFDYIQIKKYPRE
jgi:5-oxoprolinase (ATP-hydrolysing) subunit A